MNTYDQPYKPHAPERPEPDLYDKHERWKERESEGWEWPRISAEKLAFIEANGGEYQGYIRMEDGSEQFRDFLLTKIAGYEESLGGLFLRIAKSEGISRTGTIDLKHPQEIDGYRLTVQILDSLGKELEPPQTLEFHPPHSTRLELERFGHSLHELCASPNLGLDFLFSWLKYWNGEERQKRSSEIKEHKRP